MEQKLREGDFDLEDFLKQLRQVRNMGPLNELVGMMPGMNKALRGVSLDEAEAERQLKRVEAIILSMTPEEQRNPRLLNASRKRRIARGSGTTVQQINQLLSQHRQMKDMLNKLKKGRGRGLPFPRLSG